MHVLPQARLRARGSKDAEGDLPHPRRGTDRDRDGIAEHRALAADRLHELGTAWSLVVILSSSGASQLSRFPPPTVGGPVRRPNLTHRAISS